MSAKPDDTWAIELLDGMLPELNRRTDEANERIRVFETFLRQKGVAVPVSTMVLGKTTGHSVGQYVEGLLAYDCIDGEWRIRWHGPQRESRLLVVRGALGGVRAAVDGDRSQ